MSGLPPGGTESMSVGETAAEPRTLAPFGRRLGEVTASDAVGAYRLIRVRDAAGPRAPRAGQFYMLAAAEGWTTGERPYLPRAFSFARAASGELHFLLEAIGPGTERLGALRRGDGLWLVGPLGVGFRRPATGRRPVLVGGGIGTAPILALADELPARDTTILLGFRSAAHSLVTLHFPGSPAVATDDGSLGRRGPVTGLLLDELERGQPPVEVLACGPAPMLEAVRLMCAEARVPAQLALESGMACGFGACYGCVLSTRDGYVRLCVDGPVLDAGRLESALAPRSTH